jgi:hypothetical protein
MGPHGSQFPPGRARVYSRVMQAAQHRLHPTAASRFRVSCRAVNGLLVSRMKLGVTE